MAGAHATEMESVGAYARDIPVNMTVVGTLYVRNSDGSNRMPQATTFFGCKCTPNELDDAGRLSFTISDGRGTFHALSLGTTFFGRCAMRCVTNPLGDEMVLNVAETVRIRHELEGWRVANIETCWKLEHLDIIVLKIEYPIFSRYTGYFMCGTRYRARIVSDVRGTDVDRHATHANSTEGERIMTVHTFELVEGTTTRRLDLRIMSHDLFVVGQEAPNGHRIVVDWHATRDELARK